jgi:hypothetical protein
MATHAYNTAGEQARFETAVSSSASIVKPTVPKNVLAEFQHFAATGNRFQRQNPFDEVDNAQSNDPFAIAAAIAPPPAQQRRQAPLPPTQQQPAPPPVPQPQQPQRPMDFREFGDFSMTAAQQQQANHGSMNEEKSRLISAMQQHLRLKAAHGMAMTVGELSGQIRELTGQSWGGYWEGKYGNLLAFLKSNPDSFSVVKSKYVTCKGQEDVAYRQLEREAQEASAMVEEQQRMQQSYATTPMYQQQPQQSFYAPSFDNPFGDANNNTSYYPGQDFGNTSTMFPPPRSQGMMGQQQQQQQPPADVWGGADSRSNSITSRRDSSEWQLPTGQHTSGMFAPFDPFAGASGGGDMYGQPSYIPHGNSTTMMADDWWNQSTTMRAPPPQQQQQQPRDPFAFHGFNESIIAPPSAVESPNTSTLSAEELEDIKKAERKAARKQKKQEEADEALARELQNKELEDSREFSAGADVAGGSGEMIVLTTAQMRDLAEKELGIDNVRIIAGFTVKKYGREGRPHQRKMWVTQSLTHLAWASSLLEGSHRGIELRHVTDVTAGQMTPTIARTTSDKSKVKAQCFSLVTMSRTLDMQACSVIQRDALVNALKAVVAFNHKYKPEKVDRDLTRVKATGHAPAFASRGRD